MNDTCRKQHLEMTSVGPSLSAVSQLEGESMKNQLGLFGDQPEAKKSSKRSRNGARNSDSGELLRRVEAIEGRFDRVEEVLNQMHQLMAVKKVIKEVVHGQRSRSDCQQKGIHRPRMVSRATSPGRKSHVRTR